MSYSTLFRSSSARRKNRSARPKLGLPVRLSLEALDQRVVLSGTPQLIDINPTGASAPADFVQIGAIAFFTADNGTNGRELWRTDGTPAGTMMVRDIRAGSSGSTPQNLTNVNGTLYFTADDGVNGVELWKSDGTSGGTVMVSNIGAGSTSSSPQNLTNVNGVVFFSADNTTNGRELWKSDGTAAGTVMVKDIFPGSESGSSTPYSSFPVQLTNFNGTLYFTAGDEDGGRELWKSDGTAAGTVMVKDIFPGEYEYEYEGYSYGFYPNNATPDKLTVSGGKLYFTANDGQNGRELWKTDGTAAGTVMVTNIRAGNGDAFSTNDDLLDVNGTLFFTATDDTNGRELWKTDGTAAGTVRVRDIAPGAGSGLQGSELLNVNGIVYFAASDGTNGTELWKSDGTSTGTVMVKNLDGTSGNSSPTLLTNVDGTIFFSAFDATAGNELWRSDGTADGTVRVADLVAGMSGSAPQNLFNLDGTLLFSADNLTAGRELWLVDPDAVAGLATARLTIYVDSQPVVVPANIGRSGGTKLSQVTTTGAGTLRVEPIGSEALEPVTLGDFFATWRTNAGQAGNNANAQFSATQLMGSVADTTKTVKMFVNGQIRTDFEDYVIKDGDQIVLVFGANPVVSLNTNFGPIVMELFEQQTPITVANFLDYINDGDYINSFFHRAAESGGNEFVIQGGGFKTSSTTFSSTAQFTNVPTEGQIQNEPGISNKRGTVAMAKLGNNVNSATSQFFVNLHDDNVFLDSEASGRFTVFAQVLDMTTADAIAALPRNTSNPVPYGELPLSASNQLVVIQSIEGLGEITGVKYVDANGNGQRDTGEAGVAGVTIYLDANNNGVLDSGETSTTTDSNGRYLLQLEPGTYTVRALNSPGHIQTEPTANNGYTVVVTIGIESGDRDFGQIALAAPTGVDLVADSDTGAASDDNLTRLNNGLPTTTMQFVVSGVTSGTDVRLYSDGVLIGSATATGTSVTITTNGSVPLADGVRNITARQAIGGGESDPSPALAITIDTAPPAAIVATLPATTGFGEAFTFDADSPSEGQTGIVYSLANAPTGMTIDPATGVISWTPTLAQAMPHAFAIRVTDAAGNVVNKDVTLTVLGEIPALPDAYTTDEDAPLVVNAANGVLANDGDENSGTLTATVVTQPAHGTLTLNADGSFTYTPAADFFGTDTFTYRAADNENESNIATVTIAINEVDDPVDTNPDSYTVNEDAVLTVGAANGVLANDEDPDSDSLTVTLGTSTTNGTLTLNADGSFVYTPNSNFNGTDSFTYRVNDGTTTSDPVTVTITVNAVNDNPVGVANSYSVNEDAVLNVAVGQGVLANDTDVEGSTLTASVVTNPANGTLTLNANGSFTYTPNANFFGTDTFTYRASDGTGQSESTTVTITVNAQPDAPNALDDTAGVANDGSTHTIAVLANDTSNPDPAQTLTITAVTQGNNGGTVTFTGSSLSYKPAATFVGTETFTYTIQDTDGLTDTATVTVTVTQAASNSIFGFVFVDANGNGVRDSGEPGIPGAMITLSGTPTGGAAVTRTAISTSNGSYRFDNLVAGTYQIVQDQPEAMLDSVESISTAANGIVTGNDQFTNIVLSGGTSRGELNFGERGLRPEYVSIRLFLASTPPVADMLRETVARGEELAGNTALAAMIRAGDNGNGPNNAPVAVANTYTVASGGVLSVPVTTGVLANDTDADGDTLTATVVTNPTNGTLTLNANGAFTYTPNASFSGTDTFTYTASDGTATSSAATVTITVNTSTIAPVAVVDTYAVNRNTTLTVDQAGGLLANDSDPDSTNLTAQLATNPTNGTLTLNANGSFTYVPNTGFVGTDTFTYRANDGTSSSAAVTVSISVLNNNTAPVAVANSYSTNRGVPLNVTTAQGVLANDTDADNDTLTAQLVSNATNGALTLNANGSFTYTPNAGFTGSDSFTYRANDGTTTSNTVTVTITVANTNNAPVAVANSYTVAEDTTLTVNQASGVLANDNDPNGDPLTAVLVAQPTHGTLTLNANGSFTYVPNANFTGADTFTYTASDGTANSESVAVTITVTAMNVAPVAVADSYTVGEDGTLSITAPGVLANDTDADQDALTAQVVTQPAHGTLTLNANGSFTYTPTVGYSGPDSFTYRASDGEAQSSAATVSITVTPKNTFAISESAQAGAVVGQVASENGFGAVQVFQIEVAGMASQLRLAADDHFTGDPAASLVLIEYMDLSCPHCRDIHPVVEELLDDFDGELLVVRRHLLLFNTTTSNFVFPNSLAAARATEAAARQGKFDEMVDKLFDNQDTWRTVADPTTLFNQYAQEIGLNMTQFGTDRVDPAIDARINRDRTAATALGLTSTPSFYINGEQTANPGTVQAFTTLLVDAFVDADDPFAINRETGQIFVNNPSALDAVTTPTVTLNVLLTNAAGVTQTVAVTINVTNSAPVAANDSYTATLNTALTINPALGLLANDSDPDGDVLTAQLVAGPTNGTLTLNANGSFTYTPNNAFTGTDSFTYVAKDAARMSPAATATITVASAGSASAILVESEGDEFLDEASGDGTEDAQSLAQELVDAVMEEAEDWFDV